MALNINKQALNHQLEFLFINISALYDGNLIIYEDIGKINRIQLNHEVPEETS